jgi:integral membrane sensor domain MASE1
VATTVAPRRTRPWRLLREVRNVVLAILLGAAVLAAVVGGVIGVTALVIG